LPDELIVCDDASTNETVELLRQADGLPFPTEIVVNDRNLGSTKNFEKAIGLCRGNVIALCDQDDYWHSTKLSRIESEFHASPELGLAVSDAWLWDNYTLAMDNETSGGLAWSRLPFSPEMQKRFNDRGGADLMLRWNVVTGATAAFRADLRPLLLPIPECWVHDAWIGFLAAAVAPAHAIAEPLVVYRQHLGQQIGIRPDTLYAQMNLARSRLTRGYFERQVAEFEALAERLEANADRLLDKTLPSRVREKVRLAQTQARMRAIGRLPRLGLAIRELATGRYHRYARGLRSFGVDALFP
jgi:glycosyltransferase involved in cell wall biosynthesis